MDNWLYDLVVSGLDFILLIQTYRTPFFDAFFKFITFFGDEEAYLLVLPLFYLAINKQIGQRLAYLLVLSASINYFFKMLLSQILKLFLKSSLKMGILLQRTHNYKFWIGYQDYF